MLAGGSRPEARQAHNFKADGIKKPFSRNVFSPRVEHGRTARAQTALVQIHPVTDVMFKPYECIVEAHLSRISGPR